MYTPHFVYSYSSVDGHLDCLHLLAFVNDADMNMNVQIPVWVPASNSFGFTPRSGIAGLYSNSVLSFWGITMLFSTVAVPFYISTRNAQEF